MKKTVAIISILAVLIVILISVIFILSKSNDIKTNNEFVEIVDSVVIAEQDNSDEYYYPNKAITQNIYPKIVSEKRIYSIYSEFDEIDGLIANEIILVAPCGAEVKSSHNGLVVKITDDGWNEGMGRYVEMELSYGKVFYSHLKDIFVKVGDVVEVEDKIGTAGNGGELSENIKCAFGIIQ